jgi:two-component system response regulator AtoC
MGEECPKQYIQETGKPHTCLHVHTHYDQGRHVHQVRVKGFPLHFGQGSTYYGELFEELAVQPEGDGDRHCMVGSSKPFLGSLEAMKVAARSDAPVLIQGETGTGKELAAHFVHRNSSRATRPFLTLDCTVLTKALAESELFGHVRGAFTGSVGERQGLFKLAHGGTLFLDEIGELPKSLQSKLLRVLETGEFRRVGSDRPEQTDVRVICATNRNLALEVQHGRFREDLYYRLACLTVSLPSLRQRRGDIRALAELMLQRCMRPGEPLMTLSDGALKALAAHDYPGNVRELRNILQAVAARADGTRITRAQIEETLAGQPVITATATSASMVAAQQDPQPASPGRGESLEDVERTHLQRLLNVHYGDLNAVASALGVSLRTVYRKLNRYGLR